MVTWVTWFVQKTGYYAVSAEFNKVVVVSEKSFLQSFVGLRLDTDVYTTLTWESAGCIIVLLVNFTAKYTLSATQEKQNVQGKGKVQFRRAEHECYRGGESNVGWYCTVFSLHGCLSGVQRAPINTCGKFSFQPTALLFCSLMKICCISCHWDQGILG